MCDVMISEVNKAVYLEYPGLSVSQTGPFIWKCCACEQACLDLECMQGKHAHVL